MRESLCSSITIQPWIKWVNIGQNNLIHFKAKKVDAISVSAITY